MFCTTTEQISITSPPGPGPPGGESAALPTIWCPGSINVCDPRCHYLLPLPPSHARDHLQPSTETSARTTPTSLDHTSHNHMRSTTAHAQLRNCATAQLRMRNCAVVLRSGAHAQWCCAPCAAPLRSCACAVAQLRSCAVAHAQWCGMVWCGVVGVVWLGVL